MRLGALIRSTRERHGLTQAQLALRAGTSQNAVSRIERDRISPSLDTIQRLLGAMGERLELSVRRIEGDFDPDHLADSMAQTMSERLERSLAWNRFAGELAGIARSRYVASGEGSPDLGQLAEQDLREQVETH